MSKILIGNFKGPKGDTGAQGPVGPKGEQGIQGPVGPTGPVASVNGQTGDVVIGARNLINTNDKSHLCIYSNNVVSFETVQVSDYNVKDAIRATCAQSKNALVFYYSSPRTIKVGEIYTASGYVQNNGTKKVKMHINTSGSSDVWVEAGETKRFVITSRVHTEPGPPQIQFHTEAVGDALDVTYWHLKIELGNVATDWSPAPEDIESRLAFQNIPITVNPEYIRSVTGLACWRIGHTVHFRGVLADRTEIPANGVVFTVDDSFLTQKRVDIPCVGLNDWDSCTRLLVSEPNRNEFYANSVSFPAKFTFSITSVIDDRAPGITGTIQLDGDVVGEGPEIMDEPVDRENELEEAGKDDVI